MSTALYPGQYQYGQQHVPVSSTNPYQSEWVQYHMTNPHNTEASSVAINLENNLRGCSDYLKCQNHYTDALRDSWSGTSSSSATSSSQSPSAAQQSFATGLLPSSSSRSDQGYTSNTTANSSVYSLGLDREFIQATMPSNALDCPSRKALPRYSSSSTSSFVDSPYDSGTNSWNLSTSKSVPSNWGGESGYSGYGVVQDSNFDFPIHKSPTESSVKSSGSRGSISTALSYLSRAFDRLKKGPRHRWAP